MPAATGRPTRQSIQWLSARVAGQDLTQGDEHLFYCQDLPACRQQAGGNFNTTALVDGSDRSERVVTPG